MGQKIASFLLSGVAAAVVAGAACAQDTITLRLATALPATHPAVVNGVQVFMDSVTEATGGKVKFEFYPAGQLGAQNQMLDLLKAGATDIAGLSTGAYSIDKLPLTATWELPGLATSTCDVVRVMETLGRKGGLIDQAEFAPSGLVAVDFQPFPPYAFAPTRVPVTKVEDLQGLKMRNAGGMQELTVQALGGAPVKLAAAETYDALSRGTIDTVLFSFLSAKTYDLGAVAKYAATGYSLGTPGNLLMMTESKFGSLPEDVQTAIIEAGKKSSQTWCAHADSSEAQYIAEMEAAGMQVHRWTPEQVQQLTELTKEIPANWAKELDSRGMPASQVLEAFRAQLNAAK